MRLLLDTHIAIWAAIDPDALRDTERALLVSASGPIVLSAVAIWALRLKWQSFHVSGGRKGPIEPADRAYAVMTGRSRRNKSRSNSGTYRTIRNPALASTRREAVFSGCAKPCNAGSRSTESASTMHAEANSVA